MDTSRYVVHEIAVGGWGRRMTDAGEQIVSGTCNCVARVMAETCGVAMTDSGKWAYYAPGNLGLEVVFGSVEDCVESAIAGEVRRDDTVWADA